MIIVMIMLLCREDVRTANVIACDTDGVDCLVLEREYVLTQPSFMIYLLCNSQMQ